MRQKGACYTQQALRCYTHQVRLRTYEWLLWMDADTLIMEPAQQINAALLSASAASALSGVALSAPESKI